MKNLLAFLTGVAVFLAASVHMSAQNGYEVRGVISDAFGPVVGASVIERGTTNGTATGTDGEYSLRVSSARSTIEISCIGYQTLTFVASEVPSASSSADES